MCLQQNHTPYNCPTKPLKMAPPVLLLLQLFTTPDPDPLLSLPSFSKMWSALMPPSQHLPFCLMSLQSAPALIFD